MNNKTQNNCVAITKKKNSCKNRAMNNSKYCYIHSFGKFEGIPWLKNSTLHFVITVSLAVLLFCSGPSRQNQEEMLKNGKKTHDKLDSIYANSETSPYVRFTQKVKIIKQKPDVDIIVEIIRNAFQENPINGEKIIKRIESFSDNLEFQFLNTFYMTSLFVKLENSGESLARDIKVFFQNEIVYQVESLSRKEKSSTPVTVHLINMAGKGGGGYEEKLIQYEKSPAFWNDLIDLSIEIVNRGEKIGNSLEEYYKEGEQEDVSINIQWKNLNNKEYKLNATAKLYWDGKENKITFWKYQFNH